VAVKRQVSLPLGEFGTDAIGRKARAVGVTPERLLREALLYYVADLASGRLAARPPPGCEEPSGQPPPQSLDLSVDVDAQTWRELEGASVRYEVPLEQLLAHAAFYYLSDLESGRAALRIAGKLRP
jgi:hypothetical protein